MKCTGEALSASVVTDEEGEEMEETRENSINADKEHEQPSQQKIRERDEKIQKAYLNYLELGEEHYFLELMELVDSMSRAQVAEYLKNAKGYYDADYVEDVMQEARLAMWKHINKTRETREKDYFTYGYYARGIYKMIAQQEIDKERNTDKRGANFGAFSVEKMREDGTETRAEETDATADCMEKKEAADFYAKFFDEYLRTLMETDESPKCCLATTYARLLPHIIGFGTESIVSSVKWARKKMGKHTVLYLTFDSENEFRNHGFNFFKWGIKYTTQLDNCVTIDGKQAILGDLIYLESFDLNRDIEHMDRHLHNVILKETINRLSQDSQFVALGSEYLDRDERLYKLIGGERK